MVFLGPFFRGRKAKNAWKISVTSACTLQKCGQQNFRPWSILWKKKKSALCDKIGWDLKKLFAFFFSSLYSIRACFKKDFFQNVQFTPICWTVYFRWEAKNVKKKKTLWEYFENQQNVTQMTLKTKKYFFLHFWIQLTSSKNISKILVKNFKLFSSKSVHCTLHNFR